MSIENWLQWPTKSTDPAVNAAIACVLIIAAIMLVVVGGMFLLPVLLVIGIAKGVHWYANRPTPTDQLYAQAQQRSITANFPAPEQFIEAYMDRFLDAIRDDLPAYHVYLGMVQIADAFYRDENLNNPLPPVFAANTIEEGRYRDQLIAHQRKTADAPRTLELFNATLGKCYLDFLAALPPIAKSTPDAFAKCEELETFATFPLIDVVPDPATLVTSLMAPLFREDVQLLGLFGNLRRQLDRNFNEADAVVPDQYKGTPREIVSAYLGNTPFEALFYAPIPFSLTDRQRYEHMHVVGGSGHGKTQLLQRLIVDDLDRDQTPALVIVDSQGEMLAKIQRLACFAPGGKLYDKLICIDPEDVAYPPALNMFAVPSNRIANYSQSVKEQVEAGTIELFNYIFGAIAAELTSRQNTTFAYVARLMLAIPGATIHTLRELFEDDAGSIDASPFAAHIRALDTTSQGFFEHQFFTKTYSQTKSQIARRLYGVLQVRSFDRMFSTKDNKLDMFAALQSGNIVLVNTSKSLLKTEASALFGRYMIARVIAAAFERVALPSEKRNPAFLIVDEAAEYFDDNVEALLSQARKFNLGVVLAHQHLDQLSTGLRSAVAANTSIKLAGGVSDKDARALAADMRTSADFIASMKKQARSTEFACFVRNTTGNAIRLKIPFGTLERSAKMTDEQHAAVIQSNRERYAVSPDQPRPAATSPDQSAPAAAAPATDDWRS